MHDDDPKVDRVSTSLTLTAAPGGHNCVMRLVPVPNGGTRRGQQTCGEISDGLVLRLAGAPYIAGSRSSARCVRVTTQKAVSSRRNRFSPDELTGELSLRPDTAADNPQRSLPVARLSQVTGARTDPSLVRVSV